jgi:aspartate racemase
MRTIGILGGSTDLATTEYYTLINAHVRSLLGGLHTGEIIVNSMDLALSAHYVTNNLWDEGVEYLHPKVKALERAGVDFVICVSNTWHCVSERWMGGVGVPLLHIGTPTGEAIREKRLKRVGLLGTKATMEGGYLKEWFEENYGLEIVVPRAEQRGFIDDVDFKEISYKKFTEESKRGYLEIVDELVAEGAEGVILGCTEIGLLIEQGDRPGVPMFDTMRLHARAAAERAVHG